MQKEINLIGHKNATFLERESTVIAARAISIFSAILVGSVFITTFFLGRNNSSAEIISQQNDIRSKLRAIQDKTNKNLLLVNRVNYIQKILKTRLDLSSKIDTIQKLIPPSISLTALVLSDKTVNLQMSSVSLTSLKTFLDSLTSFVDKKMFFQKVTINDIVVDGATGNYSVSVLAVYK